MSTGRTAPRARSRPVAGLVAVPVLAAGLVVRDVTTGAVGKYGGVALYAVLIHVLVVVVAPRLRPPAVAGVALGICVLVELAQLTPLPAALSERSVVARLVLGSTFNAPDLLWYAVGVAVALAVDRLVRGRTVPISGNTVPAVDEVAGPG